MTHSPDDGWKDMLPPSIDESVKMLQELAGEKVQVVQNGRRTGKTAKLIAELEEGLEEAYQISAKLQTELDGAIADRNTAEAVAVETQADLTQARRALRECQLTIWWEHAAYSPDKDAVGHDFTRDAEDIEDALCSCGAEHWHVNGCVLGLLLPASETATESEGSE